MTKATEQKKSAGWLTRIQKASATRPNIIVLHGQEGVGKTSFAANAPGVVFGMAPGEAGLLTLIGMNRVDETPYLPEWASWGDVMESLDELHRGDHDFRTLAIDTANGVERLCHEHVCATQYGGDWSKKGFLNFQEGFEASVAEWRIFQAKLDAIRRDRGMSVILLVHTKVAAFRNPEGSDFDRYVPDMHAKTWSSLHKFADMILFAKFETAVVEDGSRKKGVGGEQRTLHTEKRAAWDAKNRHGLPEDIDMSDQASEAWSNFINALKEAKGRKNA